VPGEGVDRPRSKNHSLLNTVTVVKAKGRKARRRSSLGSR